MLGDVRKTERTISGVILDRGSHADWLLRNPMMAFRDASG